jgi:translin
MENLDAIADEARRDLSAKDEAREKLLPLCRESIRFSSITIRAIHRREFEQAVENLRQARKLISDAKKAAREFPELNNGGAVRDAEKELAEANMTLAIVKGRPLPTPSSLGVDTAAYLNGTGEAAGEIRRYLLDSMRRGDLSRGEELLSAMDDIYGVLTTLDFPDAITGGLRRTTDMVRGVLEKTRSDLTLAIQQKALEERLTVYKPKKKTVNR